jgi:predicted O-methyltransferase YrrM
MTVVECGSGSSTVWLAAACRERGRGRVVALEHDPDYGEQTGAALAANGLTDHAEVRVAGLEPLELDGETFQWYARGAWSDLTGIDLLFVDGPPGATGPHARYPALPVFAPGLQDDAVVVLDDTVRAEEAEILRRWQELRLAGGHLGRARPTGRASQARWHRSDEAG